jgi:hypothetical protein
MKSILSILSIIAVALLCAGCYTKTVRLAYPKQTLSKDADGNPCVDNLLYEQTYTRRYLLKPDNWPDPLLKD